MPTTSPTSGLRKDFTDGVDNYTNADVTATVNVIDAQILRVDAIDDFAQNVATTTATVIGFRDGTVRASNGTVTKKSAFTYTPPLASSGTLTTYVEIDSAGVISGNATSFSADKKPVAIVVTNTTNIVSVDDSVRVGFDFSTGGGGGSVVDASTTVKGVVKLATAPADAANPIAVGDNDARLTNARTPTAHTHAIADTTGLQTALDGKAASAHTHTDYLNRNGSTAMTGALNAGGFKITNVAAPTAASDVATKAYTDSLASGYRDRAAVKAATTVSITLSGAQTVDSVSCIAGDRVLVKNQVTQSQNGIYVVAAGAWARSEDADTAAELELGIKVYVQNGSANGGTTFSLLTAPTTLGSDPVVWTESGSSGGGTSTQPVNVGGGSQLYAGRTGTDDQFRSLVAVSNRVAMTQNAETIDIDVVEAELDLANIGGTLPVTKGGTGLTAVATGDLIIASAANTIAGLAGNTTTTRKFLSSTGDGTNATAPVYNALRGIDLPLMGASGPNHAPGAFKSPGAVASTTRFACETGEWEVPPAAPVSTTTTSAYTVQLASSTLSVLNGGAFPIGVPLYLTDGTKNVALRLVSKAGNTYTVQPIGPNLYATLGQTFASGSVLILSAEPTASLSGASNTSFAVGTGSKTFALDRTLTFLIGARVRIASQGTPTAAMEGIVTAQTVSSLTVDVNWTSGAGTFTDWVIAPTGERGTDGAATIADGSVTFPKLQDIATNKLLGRFTASSGDVEEIALGTGLALSSGALKTTLYDIAFGCIGKPAASAIIGRLVATRAFTLPVGLVGSFLNGDTAATASTTYDVRKRTAAGVETSVGSIVVAAGSKTATFSMASQTSFAVGDQLLIKAPATPDSTHGDFAGTLVGTLA